MAGKLGTIFVEMDIDRDRWAGAQRRLLKDATSTSLRIEDNFRKLGIKSSAEMDLMRRKITNSFNMIKNSSKATANDIVRAEKAKTSQLKRLHDQQFGHQTSMLTTLKKNWMAASVAIYASMRVMRAGWDMVKEAANFEQQEKSFANLAASYGRNGTEIINELKKVSSNTISTMVLIEKAGTAMMMGIAPDKVIKLMEIARATARMTGQSISKAFSDISLAVGRQSRMILDNLGIIVSAGKANEAYAVSLGKTVNQLTDADKKMAFMNATLLAGAELMRRLGEQTDTTRDRMDRLTTVFANLKIQIGGATIALVTFIEKMTDKSLDVIFGRITGDPKDLAKQALQKQLELAMRSYELMAQQGNVDQESLRSAESRIFTLRQRIAMLEKGSAKGPLELTIGKPGHIPKAGPDMWESFGGGAETKDASWVASAYGFGQIEASTSAHFQRMKELTNGNRTEIEALLASHIAEKLILQEQFNVQYMELGKSQYDLERESIQTMAEAYRQAGADKVHVAELTAAKIKAISRAETDAKLAIFQTNASNISDTFLQIAQAGGKQSKKAFEIYKRFAQIEAGISAARAILMALGSPPGPPWSFITAGITAGMAAVQVAMIEKSQSPSYDQGGISQAKGVYQTGNISEAHIPLKSGRVPVKVSGGGATQNIQYIDMTGSTFLDQETMARAMRDVSVHAVRQHASQAIIDDYNNDSPIRTMIRGRR